MQHALSTHTLVVAEIRPHVFRDCVRARWTASASFASPPASHGREVLARSQDVCGEVYEDLGRGGWAWTRLVVVDVRCEAGDSEVLIAGTNLSG